DAEAFAFVIGGVRDCAALANIAVGQARRGDFDAAFGLIDEISTLLRTAILELAPSASILSLDVYARSPKQALITIMRVAARAGDLSLFRRANRASAVMEPKYAPPRAYDSTSEEPRLSGPFVFEELTRTGHAKVAFEMAQTIVRLPDKVAALC